METANQSRRTFLKIGAAVGGGLLVGCYVPGCGGPPPDFGTAGSAFSPNAWIRIDLEGTVTVIVDRSEMGQGVSTALPMLVAEELEVDPATVRFAFAPADKARYANPELGVQATGGSTSVKAAWQPLREAGAAAREMLIAAAAAIWQVDARTCRAQNGAVLRADGERLAYQRLVAKARQLASPERPALKAAKDFHVIGKRLPRLDTLCKVDGTAQFGMDIRLPDLLFAAIAHAPTFGGRLVSVDDRRAKAVKGVHQVVPMEAAVAVVADSYWHAQRGLSALAIQWEPGSNHDVSSAAIERAHRRRATQKGQVAAEVGDVQAALAGAANVVRAEYQLPFLAHATLEPMNCTANVREDGCEIWVPTQNQTGAREVAARISGLPHARVTVHTTYLGGGFGRRSEQDFVAEAVYLSKVTARPVKLIWSREEDTQHDFYRPATYYVLQGGLDASGRVIAWTHRIVGAPILPRIITEFTPSFLPYRLPHSVKGLIARIAGTAAGWMVDASAVEGADNLPYGIANQRVDYCRYDAGVPVGFWRSVGHSQNAFVVESFLDELAAAAGSDPVAFRQRLLSNAPRHRRVLELAADKADWGRPLAEGVYRGIALHASFGSVVAQVAEVSVTTAGEVDVKRVVCAVDCGTVINPGIVEAQMESGIAFGLTAALWGEITLQGGRVQQRNFHDYRLLGMKEMPRVEVYRLASEESPGGVGEPGTPPIAPAVTNALFAATGRRIRRLPIAANAAWRISSAT